MTPEAQDILNTFSAMLALPTGDGASKRAKGEKPHWKIDPGHEAAIFSHLAKWKKGEKVDKDSGAHPLVHAAWRCLAIAWQETEGEKQRVLQRALRPLTKTCHFEGGPLNGEVREVPPNTSSYQCYEVIGWNNVRAHTYHCVRDMAQARWVMRYQDPKLN